MPEFRVGRKDEWAEDFGICTNVMMECVVIYSSRPKKHTRVSPNVSDDFGVNVMCPCVWTTLLDVGSGRGYACNGSLSIGNSLYFQFYYEPKTTFLRSLS